LIVASVKKILKLPFLFAIVLRAAWDERNLSLGISVQKLTKTYRSTKRRWAVIPVSRKETTALKAIDFTVKKGETVGLLGPNGAGKTTTIKILSTLVLPDSGQAFVNGFDVVQQPTDVRASIGVITGGERSIYHKLTGRENLILFGRLYRLNKTQAKERADQLLGIMELEEKADIKCEDYSSGQRMKIVFARSLIHDPPTLLYDEPTLGLDPAFARDIRKLIRTKLRDKSILLCTHYMQEADYLCDRIDLINKGEIVASGTPRKLKQSVHDYDILTLQIQGLISEKAFGNLPGISKITISTDATELSKVRLHTEDGAAIVRRVLDVVDNQGGKVLRFGFEEPTLDDVFIQKTGRRISNDEKA
jgi:ABC-2 type transport system ATP-binding protein